jgi:hypothetical protein
MKIECALLQQRTRDQARWPKSPAAKQHQKAKITSGKAAPKKELDLDRGTKTAIGIERWKPCARS